MEFTRAELINIGSNVASTWGAECYDFEITPNSVIFLCIEDGEEFCAEIEKTDLRNYI